MKKILSLIFAFVLVSSLCVCALAGSYSVQAPTESAETTADAPVILGSSNVVLVSNNQLESLSEEKQAEYSAALDSIQQLFSSDSSAVAEVFGNDVETLKEIFGADVESVDDINFDEITVNYVNVVETTDNESGSAVIALDGDFTEVIAMLFVDGKWVKVNVTDNGDGTFSLDIPCSGVLCVMTK